MQQTSRRWALRDATAGLHDVVDHTVGTFATLDDYRRYLPGLLRFREAVEQHVLAQPWPQQFGGWRPTPITTQILADMSDLGIARSAAPHVSFKSDFDDLMGIVYVLEGSGLGARVLYGRAQALGMKQDFGARHLAAQVAHPESWREFLALLEEVEPLDMERVSQASIITFKHAERAFKGE